MLIEIILSLYIIIGFLVASSIVWYTKKALDKSKFGLVIVFWPFLVCAQFGYVVLTYSGKLLDKWMKVLSK